MGPPHTSTAQFLGVTTFFFVVAVIFIALRLRLRYTYSNLGFDDFLIAFSGTCLLFMWITSILMVHYGLGQHSADLSASQHENFLKSIFAQVQCYDWAITSLKIAICWQIIRIKRTSRVWVACMWVLIVCNIAVLIAAECIDYLAITPFAAQFETVPTNLRFRIPGKVLGGVWGRFLNVWFPLSDIILATIPLIFISKLNRPRSEKILLCGLLALGIACCGVSIPRLVFFFTSPLGPDQTYELTWIIYFSELEVLIGMWAACIPTLRKLFEAWLIKAGFSISSSPSSSQQGSFSWSRRMQKKYSHRSKQNVDVEQVAGSVHHDELEMVTKKPSAEALSYTVDDKDDISETRHSSPHHQQGQYYRSNSIPHAL